ncbi:MAG: CehA/McbA family metallohydrolase, partial [Gemmataceae bacterium]
QARKHKGVWVDIEKPFWWDVPAWLASGQADSIGLANNHMCRSQMYESEAWGRPRDTERLPAPRGNGYWSQEVYYHILNAGLRLPPSAGSASGVLPNPVGYNRVYVHTGKELDYAAWWAGLRAGRCFVTNGPLLRVEAAGRLPGHVFSAKKGASLDIDVKAQLDSLDPVPFLEIIKDGKVEKRVPYADVARTGSLGSLTFTTSGWFLVRAVTDNPRTFRFASTGPYHVEIGGQPRISKASAQFFLDWTHERSKRVKLDDNKEREQVLRYHRQAGDFWKRQVERANAE